MENYGVSNAGYPEEAPVEVAETTGDPASSAPENAVDPKAQGNPPSTDDGRATGSPAAAGSGQEPAEQPGLPGSIT